MIKSNSLPSAWQSGRQVIALSNCACKAASVKALNPKTRQLTLSKMPVA
jgi:hypothetical protein